MEKHQSQLDTNSIVVGHSLGPVFLLHIIEKLPHPIRAAFFVAPFISPLGNAAFDRVNDSFYRTDFDWKKIRQRCRRFHILYSDNDPYVPKEKALELARYLGVVPILVKGAGHFNSAVGYALFPFLLEKMEKEC